MQPRGENLISKCISKSLYAAAIPISNGFLYVDLRNVPALKKQSSGSSENESRYFYAHIWLFCKEE